MNRLKKKSQLELAAVAVCCLILMPLLAWLAKRNAQGLDVLIISLTAGLVVIFFSGFTEFKFYKKLDEREKDVYIKAMILSLFVFVGFWFVFSFSAFLMIGGAGQMLVGILPVALLGSLLVAQVSETAFLTIYFLMEDDINTEGEII